MTWLHKIRHWEFWPAYVIYAPAFVYWCFYAVRFKSLYFFCAANPAIQNGGLFGDRKSDIYPLLPKGCYPKSLLVHKQSETVTKEHLSALGLDFPLLVKPDIGCRGVGVERVNAIGDIWAYHSKADADFLIQEWVSWPNELGLFYCKIPGQAKGKITGLTIKRFLTVEGDGVSTLEQLMEKDPRAAMQIKKLRTLIDLEVVLPSGVWQCLVPYGNHNRGTEFRDGSVYISAELETYFDDLLGSIDGFNYGRLDIRYSSMEDLKAGKNFMIIEVNGAKSEPTHIYDPTHTFWQAQREILRHMKLLMTVVKHNRAARST